MFETQWAEVGLNPDCLCWSGESEGDSVHAPKGGSPRVKYQGPGRGSRD